MQLFSEKVNNKPYVTGIKPQCNSSKPGKTAIINSIIEQKDVPFENGTSLHASVALRLAALPK